jgi:hypothetical protein
LELPALCVDALREHRQRQLAQRIRMGQQWVDNDLVFAIRYSTELDVANVRRAFRTVGGLEPKGFGMDGPASCGPVRLATLQFGRTGFEPVTSSVSGQNLSLGNPWEGGVRSVCRAA